jgi:hypothetical protein
LNCKQLAHRFRRKANNTGFEFANGGHGDAAPTQIKPFGGGNPNGGYPNQVEGGSNFGSWENLENNRSAGNAVVNVPQYDRQYQQQGYDTQQQQQYAYHQQQHYQYEQPEYDQVRMGHTTSKQHHDK